MKVFKNLVSDMANNAKDDIPSPISAQIFDFCDPADLFSETLQNSEITASCSNGCYEDNNNNSSSLPPEIDKFINISSYQDNNSTNTNTTTTAAAAFTSTAAATNDNSCNLSVIFDSQEDIDNNDISASIDFSPSPPFTVPQFLSTQQQLRFDFSSSSSSSSSSLVHHPNNQIPICGDDDAVNVDGLSAVSHYPNNEPIINNPLLVAPPIIIPSIFDEDCLSSVPSSYVPSCSILGPYMPFSAAGTMAAALSAADSTGIFTGSLLRGSESELQLQELDFQGDDGGGVLCPDSLQRVFNPGDLQVLSGGGGESQPIVVGGAASSSTAITSEITSLEDSTFKVGKLSVEQRKEKIHRYMKKRNERNFTKKIKYACRKTLADSRPRVRGRFAKNDEFGEATRTTCGTHEEDDEEGVVVKEEEEEEMVDSSDIFAHISCVNTFNCNYPIQSWI